MAGRLDLEALEDTDVCRRSSAVRLFLLIGREEAGGTKGQVDSPSALEGKAHEDQVTRGVLLFTERDLLGRAKCLAADAFIDLLNLAAGFQECFYLCID